MPIRVIIDLEDVRQWTLMDRTDRERLIVINHQ